MAAPENNQFWKLRAKHGRDRIIKDPIALNEAANEYFQQCIENPIITVDYKGKDAERCEFELPKVFQKDELAIFCGVCKWETINQLKEVSVDFLEVVTRIENIIKSQKFQYGVLNIFNSNIIARDLGLVDKQENKLITEQPLFPE